MKLIKRILQILLAGMVSIGILCALLCAYYIIPVHVENPNRNTDYIWPANSIWVRGTEGFSFGRYDANGYNNLSVIENPDIIVVGSSQVEADNVMQNQNATYLLGTPY